MRSRWGTPLIGRNRCARLATQCCVSPELRENMQNEAVCAPDNVVATAHAAADAAGEVLRGFFRATDLAARLKSDATPVTEADTAAEAAMRAVLLAAFPEHAVLGEEGGGAAVVSMHKEEWAWVLDPIDGTKAFVAGRPTFGTLIAVLHRGVPVFGIIDQPIVRERWSGGVGRPTTLNGRPVKVRPRAPLASCSVHATTPEMFEGLDGFSFRAVKRRASNAVYGADCYAYALLASGHVDLVVEADLKPWDFLALAPVVEAAGGFMTDWYGDSIGPDCDGRVVAAASQDVLCEVLDLFSDALEPQDDVADPGPGHVEAMAGYGEAEEADENHRVSVQVSAQYHDDSEVEIDAPDNFDMYRADIAELVRNEILRGYVKVSIKVSEQFASDRYEDDLFDQAVVRRAREQLDRFMSIAGITSEPTLSEVLSLARSIASNESSFRNSIPGRDLVWRAVQAALDALRVSRRKAAVAFELKSHKHIYEIDAIVDALKDRLEGARREGKSPTWGDEVEKIKAHTHLITLGFMGVDGGVGGRIDLLAREVTACARALATLAHDAPVAHHAILIEEEARGLRVLARLLR